MFYTLKSGNPAVLRPFFYVLKSNSCEINSAFHRFRMNNRITSRTLMLIWTTSLTCDNHRSHYNRLIYLKKCIHFDRKCFTFSAIYLFRNCFRWLPYSLCISKIQTESCNLHTRLVSSHFSIQGIIWTWIYLKIKFKLLTAHIWKYT